MQTMSTEPRFMSGRSLAADALAPRHRLESVGKARELDGLLAAEPEKAAMTQRVVEQPERALLQATVEIDHHVAARDEMRLRENTVGGQAVIGIGHVGRERTVEKCVVVSGQVVVSERCA